MNEMILQTDSFAELVLSVTVDVVDDESNRRSSESCARILSYPSYSFSFPARSSGHRDFSG